MIQWFPRRSLSKYEDFRVSGGQLPEGPQTILWRCVHLMIYLCMRLGLRDFVVLQWMTVTAIHRQQCRLSRGAAETESEKN